MAEATIEAPPFWMTALESRAAVELAGWRLSRPLLERMRPGDGHPVLVLPGFTAADRSTASLRGLLRQLEYRTYGWGLGANLGPTPQIVAGLRQRIETIVEREQQPISVVGWSLGGIFGRVLARENPQSFRQVITLGSPFRMTPADRSAVSPMWESLSSLHSTELTDQLRTRDRPPLPVPTTAIYSRTDGIVSWRACIETKGPTSESVEVYGSHCGLGFNPAAAYVIANRLRQPVEEWRRFRSPVWALGAFPRAAHHRP
jgi:pimeloyl-ACP methyl ester carboxylesterase